MRVLQVHNSHREIGGEEVVVSNEAELLRDAGHTVKLLHSRNPDDSLRAASNLAMAPWNPAASHRVRNEVQAFEPDVAHIHNTWFSLSPAVIRSIKAMGVPVVMTLHNYRLVCANALLFREGRICEDCVGRGPWPGVYHSCYRDSYLASANSALTIQVHRALGTFTDFVDAFIVLSEHQRSILKRGGLPGSKMWLKPNFVPDPGPRPERASASNRIAYVGRLTREKGVRLLLDAWASARKGNLELWVLGDGPERESGDWNDGNRVRMLGTVSRKSVQQVMLSARAGVVPSQWYEPGGLTLSAMEFLAAGTPVLMSRLGAMGERGGEQGESWVVGPGVTSWREALERLTDDELVDAGSARARMLFEGQYSARANLDALIRIYQDVIDDSRRAN